MRSRRESVPRRRCCVLLCFFFNDTATTEIYTLSLHDALPIYPVRRPGGLDGRPGSSRLAQGGGDRKSTRLNSSHLVISHAVFCLKKKTKSVSTWGGILTHRPLPGLSRQTSAAQLQHQEMFIAFFF